MQKRDSSGRFASSKGKSKAKKQKMEVTPMSVTRARKITMPDGRVLNINTELEATVADIREDMAETYPELANANGTMDTGGDVEFTVEAGKKGC
jgi:hypothetical protein